MPSTSSAPRFPTYGTCGLGFDLTTEAWPRMERVFRSDSKTSIPVQQQSTERLLPPVGRLKHSILEDYPVQLLIMGPALTPKSREEWRRRIQHCKTAPHLVIEVQKAETLFQDCANPMSKAECAGWTKLGYSSSCSVLQNLHLGGVVSQEWLFTARVSKELSSGWMWPDFPDAPEVRPMGNCLRTHGIPPRAYSPTLQQPTTAADAEKLEQIPHALHDAMPNQPGAFIRTTLGVRRLLNDELAVGLGVPRNQVGAHQYPSGNHLRHTVAVHFWEGLSQMLSNTQIPDSTLPDPSTRTTLSPLPIPTSLSPKATKDDTLPIWTPPDLRPHSPWSRNRFRNLLFAAHQYTEPGPLILEGLTMLSRHRCNYDATGPKPRHLQLLWWEFPPEHWDALRNGSDMGFLNLPPHQHTPNSDMTPTQQTIALEFLDELVELGVVREDKAKTEMKTNGPLFCLPKPGQADQWRIISDMRRGGQNSCIGPEPTVFPRPTVILNTLYSAGWSAVVDASKFFYQFRARPADQPYLGCIHPTDPNRHFIYEGLPMGAASSPALAGRYGAAFLRLLRYTRPDLFGSAVDLNSWASDPYDPKIGHGHVLRCADGQPAVLVFAHCDDFLIHGHTKQRTQEALTAFLDLAVQVGLLCHPGKLTPPNQVVKYTGFLFDTRTAPCLRIPQDKLTRAQAMISYTLNRRHRISRLALSVITGTLESLVDATPSRIGHTYLRALYESVHPVEWEGEDLPYYSHTCLPAAAVDELSMWQQILKLGHGLRQASHRTGTLIPSFGDGSGTGTGGTVHYQTNEPMQMWMGTWSPSVQHFSSNWKEMRTLLATLERASRADHPSLPGATFFYFTDNLVLYFAVTAGASTAPPLQLLIRQIKLLELSLGIILEVVHIPGTALITQGTDGLSRGVWCSALQERPTQEALFPAIFAPCPLTLATLQWVRTQLPWDATYPLHPRNWRIFWRFEDVAHQHTVWSLPPEVAPLLISRLLQLYVEAPATTSFTVIVPRVLQRLWSRLSRQILRLGEYCRADLPFTLFSTNPLAIPLVLLHVPRHSRVLPPPELDSSPTTALRAFHRQQATSMRGLS